MENPISTKPVIDCFLSLFNGEKEPPVYLNVAIASNKIRHLPFDQLPLGLRKFANMSRGIDFHDPAIIVSDQTRILMHELKEALLNTHKNEFGVEEWPICYRRKEIKLLKEVLEKCQKAFEKASRKVDVFPSASKPVQKTKSTHAFELLSGFFEHMGPKSKPCQMPYALSENLSSARDKFRKAGVVRHIVDLIRRDQYSDLYNFLVVLKRGEFSKSFATMDRPVGINDIDSTTYPHWAFIFAILSYAPVNGVLPDLAIDAILRIVRTMGAATQEEYKQLEEIVGFGERNATLDVASKFIIEIGRSTIDMYSTLNMLIDTNGEFGLGSVLVPDSIRKLHDLAKECRQLLDADGRDCRNQNITKFTNHLHVIYQGKTYALESYLEFFENLELFITTRNLIIIPGLVNQAIHLGWLSEKDACLINRRFMEKCDPIQNPRAFEVHQRPLGLNVLLTEKGVRIINDEQEISVSDTKSSASEKICRPKHILTEYVKKFNLDVTLCSESDLGALLLNSILHGPASCCSFDIVRSGYDILIFSGMLHDLDKEMVTVMQNRKRNPEFTPNYEHGWDFNTMILHYLPRIDCSLAAVIGQVTRLLGVYLSVDVPVNTRQFRVLRLVATLLAYRYMPEVRFVKNERSLLIDTCFADSLISKESLDKIRD